jgi:hypothetical protein
MRICYLDFFDCEKSKYEKGLGNAHSPSAVPFFYRKYTIDICLVLSPSHFPLPRLSWSWTVLLSSDTYREPITSIIAVLLPFVTYILTLPRKFIIHYSSYHYELCNLKCVVEKSRRFSPFSGYVRQEFHIFLISPWILIIFMAMPEWRL